MDAVQYRVTWTPANGPQRAFRTFDRATAQKCFDDNAEFNPTVEKRNVTATDWQVITP